MFTERLMIRCPKLGDVTDLLHIRNSDFVLKYNAMKPLDEIEFTKILCDNIKNEDGFVIEEKESGKIIGMIFAEEDSLRYKINSVCLAYYIDNTFSGKGYMTEALGGFISYLFSEKNYEVISARVFDQNIASVKVLEKLGFTHEGTIRQCVMGYNDIVYNDMVFSLLKSEYINK